MTCQDTSLKHQDIAAGGTFGAHQCEIRPEATRTAEMPSTAQGTCVAHRQRSRTRGHGTPPIDQLLGVRPGQYVPGFGALPTGQRYPGLPVGP
jgi:hypothetical protein